ncbi:hypothetical protein GCM10010112_89540 [Actinoplanes lobatus]|uniref:Uncharacterized protein n=1 Tax=Actinoplanes lobatus TaxID=113568 RepID=A0A7W7HJV1_9ACTN|nr:hypothetical protein [Actinoplanes lobatus]MBB4751858.1 hypothetical protein [Actinoplanes lobatus]GGN97357.1 hypothetical protein GCM10010112_89540 [Actinoplanes lobatus]GIE45665.1 hypothetical protein Alo02nite_85630 [Actinoplanes lobatus]
MWAAITERHPLLWIYEAFAFRDGRFPHRLAPEPRDRYVAEMGEYLRLVGAVWQIIINYLAWQKPAYGALSGKARACAGLSPGQSRRAYVIRKLSLPMIWLMQRPRAERHFVRVMWGPRRGQPDRQRPQAARRGSREAGGGSRSGPY